MKFGLAASGLVDPKLLVKMAIRAEELGYDSFLVTDHFMNPVSNRHLDDRASFRTLLLVVRRMLQTAP
jgi:alkanesulfonate monooxygenase SsuD/methylene tetrahydromethanopterin reductase-like flavin-dependent oxidoreductase (luciferase family)